MAEITVSSLPIANTLSINDRVLILTNPSSAANVKTISVSNFANIPGNTNIAVNANVAGSLFVANNVVANATGVYVGTSNIVHTAALANGYSKLTNNLLLQFGSATVNSTPKVVTFSTTTGSDFVVNCYSVTATANIAGGSYAPAVYAINATAFTTITANTANAIVTWLAIGI
jgi:hypothetical protein